MRLKVIENLELRVHYMNLHDEPFKKIKNLTKNIEMRVNDEKRQQLNVGDTIVFTNNVTNELLKCRILNLHYFDSFKELYLAFDKIRIGYNQDDIPNPIDMEQYYKAEKIQQYGVVGIEIQVLE